MKLDLNYWECIYRQRPEIETCGWLMWAGRVPSSNWRSLNLTELIRRSRLGVIAGDCITSLISVATDDAIAYALDVRTYLSFVTSKPDECTLTRLAANQCGEPLANDKESERTRYVTMRGNEKRVSQSPSTFEERLGAVEQGEALRLHQVWRRHLRPCFKCSASPSDGSRIRWLRGMNDSHGQILT